MNPATHPLYTWTPDEEAAFIVAYEAAESTRLALGYQEARVRSAHGLRWELFLYGCPRRIVGIVALGGDEGITNAQLQEVYTPPPSVPAWSPKQPLDWMLRHGVLRESKESRLNKAGATQPQIVYRVGDLNLLDGLRVRQEEWQADLEEKGLKADWPSF